MADLYNCAFLRDQHCPGVVCHYCDNSSFRVIYIIRCWDVLEMLCVILLFKWYNNIQRYHMHSWNGESKSVDQDINFLLFFLCKSDLCEKTYRLYFIFEWRKKPRLRLKLIYSHESNKHAVLLPETCLLPEMFVGRTHSIHTWVELLQQGIS